MKKLSDYVIEFVAGAGVKHIFMLAGGGSMHLVDSVGRHRELEYVCCLHEQACAFAAEHYAEFTNGLGVALVTTGPGGTNAVTGLAAAWLESASCLFLSGQAKRGDLIGATGVRSMGQQEVDIVAVVKPLTKYAVTVLDPATIRYHLEKAVYLATHGRRGPVWIDIPLDVQAATIDETGLRGFVPPPVARAASLERQVSEAIDLIDDSQRPVLFLGNGSRAALAGGELGQLVDLLKIPVLVTWKMADFLPEANPYYAGRPGAIGQRGANFTEQNADCLIIVGARLDRPQTAFSHRNFARAATKIMVDVDAAELAKIQPEVHVPVCADAGVFTREFLRQANRLKPKDRSCWVKRAKEWSERYPVVLPEYWADAGAVNTYVLMDVLSDELAATDVIVPGSSGPCSDIFMQAFRVKAGQRIVNAPGLGAMGTGLPGAIGACLASGRRRTVNINGDGGFQLNVQELETVRRLNLPIKFFVLANGGYASIMATQRNYFGGRFVGSEASSHLTLPDIERVAAAYGLPTAHIHDHGELRQGVREVLALDGPVVCAVDTPADQPTAPRVTSSIRPDGTIVSKPMEDMWPFLGRDEFLSNMIVPPLEEEA
ncbi:MAG: thiamine pyrophosphate-binding protein [Bryobacteraceae bacterium]